MRKFVLMLTIFALPFVLIGVDGMTQDGESTPFWLTFDPQFHAEPEFITVSAFGNGGPADQFNFGGLDLLNTDQGYEVDQKFSTEFAKTGNSSLDCDSGLQIGGSALFEVLEVRVGQRWEGQVLLGENRSVCFDLTADPEYGGDYLLFEVRLRAKTEGMLFFSAKPDSLQVSYHGTEYSPVHVLINSIGIEF